MYKNSNILILCVLVSVTLCLLPLIGSAITVATTAVSPAMGTMMAFVIAILTCVVVMTLNGYLLSRLVGGLPQGNVTCSVEPINNLQGVNLP
jgi:ABC-type transport system involved in multi-copper enzyme maturation permease subunit